MIEIKACERNSDFLLAEQVIKDYLHWLDMDLSFQAIERELADIPSMYGPPHGLFLLAWHKNEVAGGVALRKLTPSICEMKRLYVYDHFKNRGVGRSLCTVLIQEARDMGYKKMRLDTLGYMKSAIGLYRSLGFKEIRAYRFNSDPTAKYMELRL